MKAGVSATSGVREGVPDEMGKQDGEPLSYVSSPQHTGFPVFVGLAWSEMEINRSAYNVLKKNKAG